MLVLSFIINYPCSGGFKENTKFVVGDLSPIFLLENKIYGER
jgi:hypothetical protein